MPIERVIIDEVGGIEGCNQWLKNDKLTIDGIFKWMFEAGEYQGNFPSRDSPGKFGRGVRTETDWETVEGSTELNSSIADYAILRAGRQF